MHLRPELKLPPAPSRRVKTRSLTQTPDHSITPKPLTLNIDNSPFSRPDPPRREQHCEMQSRPKPGPVNETLNISKYFPELAWASLQVSEPISGLTTFSVERLILIREQLTQGIPMTANKKVKPDLSIHGIVFRLLAFRHSEAMRM